MPMNRLPSGVMSYGLAPPNAARLARNPRGSGTGLPTVNAGCVVTNEVTAQKYSAHSPALFPRFQAAPVGFELSYA